MDNLAHSLVGAWMAETGLKRTTPLAMVTLVIAGMGLLFLLFLRKKPQPSPA